MTEVETTYVYSGLQSAIIYELNEKARPKATSMTAYTGKEVYATKTYNPSLPQPRKVPHIGNDRLLKTQIFPGQESASAELAVGAEDLELLAMIMGTSIKEIAGMKLLPYLSNLQGKEKSVGVILFQAALARETSRQGYRTHIIPVGRMVPRQNGAGNEPIDFVYDITINPSEKYLWGANLAPLGDIYDPLSGVPDMEGVYEAGLLSGFSTTTPRIASFIVSGAAVAFEYPASLKAANAVDVAVFTAAPTDDESELVDPADYTATVDGITFDTTPGNGNEVHIVYQVAE